MDKIFLPILILLAGCSPCTKDEITFSYYSETNRCVIQFGAHAPSSMDNKGFVIWKARGGECYFEDAFKGFNSFVTDTL